MSFVRQQHTSKIIARAKRESSDGNIEIAWKLLEEAHIFSQPYAALHLYVHWEMLMLAVKEKTLGEAWGQFLRLVVAVPGSWSRKYPLGNTGRSNVSMFEKMPLSKRMAAKIAQLEKLEEKRIANGGELPKHQRQHPITKN